ncbi:hypothetical protein HCN44_009700 [Aphidius gifuensis]|uniref:Uncharacterized protein n=1 Tax=Aphidius gifuensis TaxID=684658 RepID=A0A834Y7W9_APHGI|nr:probable serine/threonine-protein kinase DDB_G0278845 [Aphidius gifuensis]XP_044020236.1 probable serine/threonine-protein kinase DDB_G0278845 [Aphidius gifuensis]XP_044020237.1 probable serine/threonine-protein kinase DDB_G0278845 [Aphidius gifuensis]KAF7998302.1 hypothetical protein HCN44_009700 [Aphidius gifuensis]
MRNPGLRIVGISSTPGGGGVFGNRAEEELRLWLETRLDALGIDPVAYSRFVLSLLRRPDSALSSGAEEFDNKYRTQGRRYNRQFTRTNIHPQGDREQKRAVVQCLTNAADQKFGIETLVDELCAKLRDLEGGDIDDNTTVDCHKIEAKKNNNFESLTPRDRALRYYAAFPALQPSTPKKITQIKDNKYNSINNLNNNKYRNNNGLNGKKFNKNINDKHNNNSNNNINKIKNNKINHKERQLKKTKMSIQSIDTRKLKDKETFGFAKSLEREREKELDDLRLAQLQAKFDESLEALWDSGPGNSNDKSSIWAAPSLSIPSGPHWPISTNEMSLILPITNITSSTIINATPKNEYIIDDLTIKNWNIDLIDIDKYNDDDDNNTNDNDNDNADVDDKKINYNFNWSNNIDDTTPPWCWKNISNNIINIKNSPNKNSCFIPIPPSNNKSSFDIINKKIKTNDVVKTVDMTIDNNQAIKDKKQDKKDGNDDEEEEDLLTSTKTHFRPIKNDGKWADGTTFPVNNNFERVAYRRSNSNNLFYLPGGESPYMEYKDNKISSATNGNSFTLKFRVRQCDKSIQTDPIRSSSKLRILTNDNNHHFYYPSIKNILKNHVGNDDDDDDDEDDYNDEDDDDVEEDEEDAAAVKKKTSFLIEPFRQTQPSFSIVSDRKRRHSSSFKGRPFVALRPSTR